MKEQEPASVTHDSARRCPPEGTRARVPRGGRSLPVTRAVMSSSCSNGVVDLHAMLDPVSESSSFFPFGRFKLSARPVAASALICCATCTPAGLAQITAAKRRAQLQSRGAAESQHTGERGSARPSELVVSVARDFLLPKSVASWSGHVRVLRQREFARH